MFDLSVDERLSAWAILRQQLETADDPLQTVWDFWAGCPFVPYNNKVDPFYQKSWPTPWEIIAENRYDDFTKALMIGYSLKYTDRYKNSQIELRIFLDNDLGRQYNVVCVEDLWAINYSDNGPEQLEKIPGSFLLENITELNVPR
jgi:hypothetical protein